jgi:hypothetical protein
VALLLDISIIFDHEFEFEFQGFLIVSFSGFPHLVEVSHEHVKIFLADIMWSWTVVTVLTGFFEKSAHGFKVLENSVPVHCFSFSGFHHFLNHSGEHLGVLHAFTL